MSTSLQVIQDNEDFESLLEEAKTLHHYKNKQYCGAWRKGGIPKVIDNLDRKLERYGAIIKKGILEGESVRDTLIDISIYSLMLIQLMDEEGTNTIHTCPFCGSLVDKKDVALLKGEIKNGQKN